MRGRICQRLGPFVRESTNYCVIMGRFTFLFLIMLVCKFSMSLGPFVRAVSPSGWTHLSSLPPAFGRVDLHHGRCGPRGTDYPEPDPVNHGGILRDSNSWLLRVPIICLMALDFHASEILQGAQMGLIASCFLNTAYSFPSHLIALTPSRIYKWAIAITS